MSAGRLKFEGCQQFRYRVVSSLLSGKQLKITKIRMDDDQPGLHDFEANFLRFIELITDGTSIEINDTGTILRFTPGLVVGGSGLTHDCGTSRSIGWFLEPIIPLLVFAKESTQITLFGITNDAVDMSVDVMRNVTLPLLRNFGISAEMKIKKRGAPPNGGGVVEFSTQIVRELRPVALEDMGLIKRVRGVAYSSRVSPTILTRVVDAARGVLNNLLPDVYVHTDHYKGADGGNSPGYSLALVAESTTGVLISAEYTATQGSVPEDIGTYGAALLLQEIRKGGVVDSSHQSLVLILMILCPEDVCKVRFGQLSDNAIGTLRLIRDIFGVVFKLKEDRETNTVMLSCLGTGYRNVSRRAT
jgi:RNA 3'-terminal phosphate cyclase-like protein